MTSTFFSFKLITPKYCGVGHLITELKNVHVIYGWCLRTTFQLVFIIIFPFQLMKNNNVTKTKKHFKCCKLWSHQENPICKYLLFQKKMHYFPFPITNINLGQYFKKITRSYTIDSKWNPSQSQKWMIAKSKCKLWVNNYFIS